MDLYYAIGSPSCRATILTAKALGIEFNLKPMDLFAGDHMKPEYLAINHQHTIPTLVDGDFKLSESRAICSYLVNQYGKDDSLYPTDAKRRAPVDRMLFFDMGTLYERFASYTYPVMRGIVDKPDPEKLEKLQEALRWLNSFLKSQDYVSGTTVTIADHSIVATVSSIAAAGIDLSSHGNLSAWFARCKANMPGYELNEEGAQLFGDMVKSKLQGK